MAHTQPIKLKASRAWRTYTGGSQIDKIHGILGGEDTQFPEEWIMSTTSARNPGREEFKDEGMCYLEDEGVSLLDYIKSNPIEALGESHAAKVGETTGVLVKVIDAAERLTVQVHPNKQKAMELFNSQFGKTESWHILGGRTINGEEPCIYMGFKEGITREEWKKHFDEQNIPAMLGCMHKFPVKAGETYLIKGGVPHAIGCGCLLIEIQEPTDYTIRIERITPKGLHIHENQIHQGLGFDRMFDCFDYDGFTYDQAKANWCVEPKLLEETKEYTRKEIIGYNETPCFKLEKYELTGTAKVKTDGIFCGLYFIEGKGSLNGKAVVQGDQFFVPASCDEYTVTAAEGEKLTFFRCFGPQVK